MVGPFFFGASLVALEKKDGWIRPIAAVGCSLRHLAAKCAGSKVMQGMGQMYVGPTTAWLWPAHLGTQRVWFGHAARTFLSRMDKEVFLKIGVMLHAHTLTLHLI